jgi:hypothetical protein
MDFVHLKKMAYLLKYPYASFHKDQSFNPGYKNGVLPEHASAVLMRAIGPTKQTRKSKYEGHP